MAVWSEVALSELAGSRRIDAEYYDPALLRFEAAVKNCSGGCKSLGELAEVVTDGDHLKRNYVDDGMLFLTSENFREHTIDYMTDLRIEPHYEQTLARSRAEVDAVFLTKTGKWYGKAVVCRNDQPQFNISADVAKIRLYREYDPYFLACYLNSDIGYALVRRESTGGSRDRIILDNLRTLPVPVVRRTETRYRKIVDQIANALSAADDAYREAEELLEAALGFNKLDLTGQLFYEQHSAGVRDAGRCDAEYFSPRMQNLITALSRTGRTVADFAKLAKRRFKPKAGIEFQYIEISDITGSGSVVSTAIAGEEAPSRATWIVKAGDIITTTVRPIRRLSAIISHEQSNYVCSSGFVVLTPRSPKDVAPELLLVYLRLPLVCELLDLYATASMYPAISTSDLMKIPIALPDDATRRKIVAKVQESFDARHNVQLMLDQAKTMVEGVILFGK